MGNMILEVRRSDNTVKTYNFGDGTYTVGRDEGDIVLNDPQTSGKHAQFEVNDKGVVFKDLGSTNGSYFDGGLKIEKLYMLKIGNIIKMGDCSIKLVEFNENKNISTAKTMLTPALDASALVSSPPPPAASTPAQSPPKEASIEAESSEKQERQSDSESSNFAAPSIFETEGTGFKGYFDSFISFVKFTYSVLFQTILEPIIPVLIISLPLPLLSAILVEFLFFIPGLSAIFAVLFTIISFLVSLPVTLFLVLVIYPVIARWIMALYLGIPLTMGQAWKQHKKNLGNNILNTFITTLIAGLTLGLMGVFIFQIPCVESKSNMEVNSRSWNLFKANWKYVGFTMVGNILIFYIPAFVITLILSKLPLIGGIATTLVTGAAYAAMIPWIFFMLTHIYFEIREKLEGEDPRPDAKSAITRDLDL